MNIATNERITIKISDGKGGRLWVIYYDSTLLCHSNSSSEAMHIATAVSKALQAHKKAEAQGHGHNPGRHSNRLSDGPTNNTNHKPDPMGGS